jgi:hypothetical protein
LITTWRFKLLWICNNSFNIKIIGANEYLSQSVQDLFVFTCRSQNLNSKSFLFQSLSPRSNYFYYHFIVVSFSYSWSMRYIPQANFYRILKLKKIWTDRNIHSLLNLPYMVSEHYNRLFKKLYKYYPLTFFIKLSPLLHVTAILLPRVMFQQPST